MAGKPLLLLDLPGACLVAVLKNLAATGDHRSLFSAARAHSRLHQAAAVALSSFTVGHISKQQQVDDLLLYLAKHGQHVCSVDLSATSHYTVALHQLPPTLRLGSLTLHCFELQLQPGHGCLGVLGPAAGLSALTQLRLAGCNLLDGNMGLAAALAQLGPGLQHLSVREVQLADCDESSATEDTDTSDEEGAGRSEGASSGNGTLRLPASVLQGMQQLTHLDLCEVMLVGPDQREEDNTLQPLQALSQLVDLRLTLYNEELTVTASMLSGLGRLTRLELGSHPTEPAVLDGRTQLQHLALYSCNGLPDDAGWVAQLLSRLQPLQQLTHLSVAYSLTAAPGVPAAAYSALTASSRLQHLDIRGLSMPVGGWQHMFRTARQLPELTSLNMVAVKHPPRAGSDVPGTAALEGSRLASCCPGLRSLDVHVLQCSAGEIAALQGLTGLRTLLVRENLNPEESLAREEVLCELAHLTGLRQLVLAAATERLLSQLTTLVQLTELDFYTWSRDPYAIYTHMDAVHLIAKGPDGEPVWRQLLRYLAAPPPFKHHAPTGVHWRAAGCLGAQAGGPGP